MTDRANLEEAIETVSHYFAGTSGRPSYYPMQCLKTLVEAGRAHLATLPKTKMVEVWRVEWCPKFSDGYKPVAAHYETEQKARDWAADLSPRTGAACIRVTGPHLQEVPA